MRGIYDIYFRCACGNSHFAFARQPILYPEDAKLSAAEFYMNNAMPEDLRSFMEKPFRCKIDPDIIKLPELEAFFFELAGQTNLVA